MAAATPFNMGALVGAPSFTVVPTVNGGVVQVACEPIAVQRSRYQLTNVRIDVDESLDYGSAELFTFPDKNLIVFGCEVDLSIVKAGTTNGIVAATDLDVSLGTAAASNATLATTMLNVLPKQDVDSDALTVTVQAHSLASTVVLTPVLDGPTNKLYLNLAPGNITASDSVLVSGTVDLFTLDLRNVTS